MDLSTLIWAGAVAVTLLAGFVKGAVGFAMPLIMVSGMSMMMDPVVAVAAVIGPIVVSNALQTFRTGWRPALEAVREHALYVGLVCVAIAVFAQLLPRIDPRAFALILGVPVVVLSLLQLVGWHPVIPAGRRGLAAWTAGLTSGALGGLAGTWGPTTVLYLMAIETPRARQMVVQGVIYGAGSVVLLASHVVSGVLNRETLPLTLILLAPALLGLWAGFAFGDRLDAERFRRITLVVLVIAGLNLIRRGLFG